MARDDLFGCFAVSDRHAGLTETSHDYHHWGCSSLHFDSVTGRQLALGMMDALSIGHGESDHEGQAEVMQGGCPWRLSRLR